ncbi:MAG: 2,3-bisphosphoglycerate-independent phosphoglycerate mutase [Vulcanimicrobiota bacterium]
MQKKPFALIVLDGFGLAPPSDSNAVFLARTPNFDRLWEAGPRTKLIASGEEVGLPEGQMGNSEVGHLNLGAGRIVMQSLSYINHLIQTGAFFNNGPLRRVMEQVGEDNSLHIMGLASRGRVHSALEHLFALIKLADQVGVRPVYLHLFTDGRDCPPDSGLDYVKEIEDYLQAFQGRVAVASVTGRYYAMDRDNRWERVKSAYNTLVDGTADFFAGSASEAVSKAYQRGETDEFIKPTVIVDRQGEPVGPMANGDGVIFFNFRADRGREMTYALMGDSSWGGFERNRVVSNLGYCSLTEYDQAWNLPFAFQVPEITEPLAEVLSKAGLRQYHTAETEKYPHVTYFFNAKVEEQYPGEERYLVPSPKVATYDLQPEMSAPELARATAERIDSGLDDFILLNFANPDMVGHTGVLEAAVAACEASDAGLGLIVAALERRGGAYLVVADHGNAETMEQPDGAPHTAHTTNLVPCVLGGSHRVKALADGGKLGDVAPTLLELMGLAKPPVMTGCSLISEWLPEES